MRILVVPNGFPTVAQPYNGIFVLRQIRALMELGHEVRVLRVVSLFAAAGRRKSVTSSPVSEAGDVPVAFARRIVLPRLAGLGLARTLARAPIANALRAFRADVIHAHGILPAGYLAFGRGVPVILTSHGSDAYLTPFRRPDLERAARRALQRAAAVAGVSDFIKRTVATLGRRDATVIFNGADERVFRERPRGAAKNALGISEERFTIAFVGNLLVAKGIFELAMACEALRDLHPLLLIAGDGPAAARFFADLDARGVEHRRLGNVDQHAVAAILAAADVVTLPSYQEGLPSILCEAMLSHRAVVASPVGGIPEIVTDGSSGWIVPVRDAAALAAALRRVHDRPEQRDAFEREAGAFAQRHLTWRVNARAYERLYTSVLAEAATA